MLKRILSLFLAVAILSAVPVIVGCEDQTTIETKSTKETQKTVVKDRPKLTE